MALRYGVDTNVLLRLSNQHHPQYEVIATALRSLVAQGAELCFTPQNNIGELWNTSTRPVDRNGFGLSIGQTERHIAAIERTMTLLVDDEQVYRAWRRLLTSHEVRGVQVHDAHLAATLEVHHVTHLLTFNGSDFKRFPNLFPVSPEDIHE